MDQEGAPTIIDLEEGSEWRFELENDENIAVRVSARIRFCQGFSGIERATQMTRVSRLRNRQWTVADHFYFLMMISSCSSFYRLSTMSSRLCSHVRASIRLSPLSQK